MAKNAADPAEYILPLYMNGLEGRVLRLPAPDKRKREILFIYGQHSSLERWWGLAQVFNRYASVTMPDLPGFGGMTSLYKIGQKGSIDDLADYLASFIKFRYRKRKVVICGMSLGFAVVTRMLQKYPDMTKQVEVLVSIVGPAHKDDFIFPVWRRRIYACITWFFSLWLPSIFFRVVFLNPAYLRRAYKHSRFAKEKLGMLSGDEFKRTMDMELNLWKINDIRTQMRTNYEMMTLDQTKIQVPLKVWHVASKKDRYFNHAKVEEHMRRIYSDFQVFFTKDPNHAPTIIADEKAAAPFVPPGIRRVLRGNPKQK